MKKVFTKLIGACSSTIMIFLLTTINLNAQYCDFSGTSPGSDYITNVTFVGIDNTTAASGYSDFTSMSAIVSPGMTYDISATMGNAGIWTETLTVYIDWDQNQVFDASERYDLGSCTSGDCATPGISGSIDVPAAAVPGETRMRVIGKYNTAPIGPCDSDGEMYNGEVEDYTINVLSGECTPPNYTYSVINDCEGETYSVSALLTDFGTSSFITVYLTRSDEVPVNPVTLIFALEGEAVNLINNVPFGVTVSASIEGSNPLCTLTRNWAELYCHIDGEICDAPIEVTELPFEATGNTAIYLNDYDGTDVPPVAVDAIENGFPSGYYLSGYDVVYAYTPENDGAIDISTINGVYASLWVFTGCPFDSIVGFHTEYAEGTRAVPHLPVLAGTTYYIVISTGSTVGSIDYTLNITPWEDCEGTPSAGMVEEDMMVCAATTFDLIATGTTPDANGLIYTWQSSEPGLNQWTDLEAANSVEYSLNGGVTEATDFRLKAYCTASDETTYSDAIAITLNPVYTECYCAPTYTYDCGSGDDLSNVSLTGESVVLNNTTECTDIGYTDFTEMPAVDLAPGETYSLSASTTYGSPLSEQVIAWIDYNLNGAFEATEQIANSNGNGLPGGTDSFEFSVPEGLDAGIYRLRVRLVYGSVVPAWDACDSQSYGETEDYNIEILTLDACAGTPVAGIADLDAIEVCATIGFSLEISGASEPADGLTRIWQSSPAGEDNWTDILGANSNTYSATAGITEATDFRYKATCINSGETDYSNVVQVSLSPATACYCIPTYNTDCGSGDDLSNVTLVGETVELNNTTDCSEDGYADFTDMPAVDLAPGETYSLSASTTYSSPLYEQVIAWIDYNLNGAFELTEQIANTDGNGLPGGTDTFEFTVPEGLDAGIFRLRVRLVYGSGVPTWNACDNQSYGETQDYNIQVLDLDACAGTPDAGTADLEMFNVCSGSSFALNVTGSSDPSDGLSRIWQSSPAGEDTWADIAGATSTNYTYQNGVETPTDFRYSVMCANSDESDISNTIQVGILPAIECYCTPSNTVTTDYFISNVSTDNALQDLDRSSGFTEGGYADYTETDTLIAHANQEFDFSLDLGNYTSRVGIWVDFNQDGNFDDADENIILTTTYVSNLDGTLLVPAELADGSYRMRIRTVSGLPAPCGANNYSEAEDYVLKVITLNECAGTPIAGTASDSFTICPTNDFSLEVVGASSPADGLERIWQSSPAGENEWNDIAEATSTSYTVEGGITADTDFRYRVTCTNSDESVYSNVVEATVNTIITDCYCIPEGTNSTYQINNFSTSNGVTNITNLSSGFTPGGYGDFTSMTVSQVQTQSVDFTEDFVGGTAGFRIWVDWNQDGAFDTTTEVVYQSSSYSATHSGSFVIPETALPGITRMRVVGHYLSTSGLIDPCGSFSYGEFEDYTLEVIELELCDGTPSAGVADDELFICPNSPLTLSVTGASEPATGLVRGWQSSPAGEDNWTDIADATSTTLYLAGGVSEATNFRYAVTCENSGETVYSNSVEVTINTNVTECYCIPEATNSARYISDFSTTEGVENITNTGSGFSNGGYGDFTDMTVSQVQTQDISFSETSVGGTAGIRIWVDWNQDGSFDTETEVVYNSSSYSASHSGTFTIPQDALAGTTRMRVVSHYLSSTGTVDPCITGFTNGEFEDYTLEIIALDECAGTPSAGVAEDEDIFICPNTPLTLSVTGASNPATGLIAFWQSSPAGENTWTDIAEATETTYIVIDGVELATDFRYVVVCENSDETSYSNVIEVTINTNASECYCTPEATNAARYISDFATTEAIGNVTNEGSGFSDGGYGDFTSMTLDQANEGSVSFSTTIVGGTAGFRIWVDWNQDSSFDNENEVAYQSSGYSATHSGSFTVPADALPGETRMRIVSHWLSTSGDVDPCITGFTYGEFEDYTFNVAGDVVWDCPNLEANIGDACDDQNADTDNDMITEDCECAGTPIVVEFDCPVLEANIGDACDDQNADTDNDMITETCECEGTPIVVEFDCPDFEANYGDACELAAGMGILNSNCECVPAPVCNNFTYYLADHDAAEGISDIYGVTLSGGVATMSYIATSDIEVHIAFNESENQIYAVSKHTNSYRTLDPFTGVWGATIALGADYGELTAAVFNADGKLLIGSQNQNAIFSVNVNTNVVSNYDTYSPITGGDLAFGSDGMLYLATRSGNGMYQNWPHDVMADVMIGSVPTMVTGLAITATDALLVSAQGQNSLQLYSTTGSNIGSYTLELDGESYTLRDGDMASGCNTGDEEVGDCDDFSTFYINHGPDISGSNLYGVTFTSGGMANMTYLANVPYEAHIAFNPQANVVYLVNVDGSFVRSYDVSTDVFIGDLLLVDDFVKITAAHYNADNGLLYIGDHNTDEVYSVNLTTGIATFYANGPVSGGDIVMNDLGIMYLATRSGEALYQISGGTANEVGGIGANVTGMALSNQAPNLILSNKGSGVFTKVSAIDASVISTYTAMLSGSPFTLGDGDMASGCADEDVTPPVNGLNITPAGMLSAFPNPTSGQAQVVFRTAETGRTLVEVYDMSGRNVATLFNAEANEGQEYRLNFDGAALPNGVYIYRMTTAGETIIEKFMIAK